jgi:hypothetical protein
MQRLGRWGGDRVHLRPATQPAYRSR